MPKFSVIIPAYNSERFLNRTISSVLKQTFRDFELIVVDDCSADGTRKIIEEFEKRDERVIPVYLEKNSGTPACPKNAGFKLAKGEYVAYLDHDDEWLPQKLEKQLELIERVGDENIGIVSCNAFEIEETASASVNPKLSKQLSDFKDLEVVSLNGPFKQLKYRSLDEVLTNPNFYCGNNSVMVLPRKTVEAVGPRDEGIGAFEDTDIIFRVAQKGYDFYFVDEPLCKIYTHGGNFTKNYARLTEKQALLRGNNFRRFFGKFDSHYAKLPFLRSERLRGIGMLYMLGNDRKSARKFFLEALKTRPFNCKNFFSFFLSFFGAGFYRKLFKLKSVS